LVETYEMLKIYWDYEKIFFASELNITVFLLSPYVVKYYGSYFKNTDLWIVMEYCGAGSVSDIIRLRNKTVSI
jgi:serine/threonine protein kinase